MASVAGGKTSPPLHLEPTEVYHHPLHPSAPIRLRIATGGAGQSGLIRALSQAFIADETSTISTETFSIAWCASDTSLSFNSLALRGADLAITYHPIAEEIALSQGIADRHVYAWRDHWMLVGPSSNPADLPIDKQSTIQSLFVTLFKACIATQISPNPIKFLSRYDKSANNIKESALWASIGQTPWSHPYSPWYHRFVEFPFKALETAARLGEYTITDQGTWLGVEGWVRDCMSVFKAGGDGLDDLMLNPAHALVGTCAENKVMANRFVDWLVDEKGGQEVIRTFASKDGTLLYTIAPTSDELVKSIQSRL